MSRPKGMEQFIEGLERLHDMYWHASCLEPLVEGTFVIQIVSFDKQRLHAATLGGESVEVEDPDGQLPSLTAVQLGKKVRELLGLDRNTPLGVFTQIVFQGVVMEKHQPLTSLLSDTDQACQHTPDTCVLCQEKIERGCPSTWTTRTFSMGPCVFCGDSLRWHHVECCTHNPKALHYDGLTHRHRTLMKQRRFDPDLECGSPCHDYFHEEWGPNDNY